MPLKAFHTPNMASLHSGAGPQTIAKLVNNSDNYMLYKVLMTVVTVFFYQRSQKTWLGGPTLDSNGMNIAGVVASSYEIIQFPSQASV